MSVPLRSPSPHLSHNLSPTGKGGKGGKGGAGTPSDFLPFVCGQLSGVSCRRSYRDAGRLRRRYSGVRLRENNDWHTLQQ